MMPLSPELQIPVLIVGGGPVGLTAALELGRRGIRCLVAEPRREVSHQRPRAKTTSIRSMEHFRRLGVAGRIREVAPLKVEWSQDVVFCTTLLGEEIYRFSDCLGLFTEKTDLTPEPGQQIAQPLVEEVLREAVEQGPEIEFWPGWKVTELSQQGGGVQATLESDTGEISSLRAEYALGCDGARSLCREAVGARFTGQTDGRPNVGFVFDAPGLAEQHSLGSAVHYWVLNPDQPGLLGRLNLQDRWWGIVNGVRLEDVQADPEAYLSRLIGKDVPLTIVGLDPWTARMLLAERYREGRIFLVGDAAHQNPPWGGHGFNTGIGDATNIGWKLAAVLQGWGGEGLLDSYEAERRPVAERTIEETVRNMKVLSPELGSPEIMQADAAGEAARTVAARSIADKKDREFHSLGLVLGYQYAACPVVIDDGVPVPPDSQEYVPSTHPGARLPQHWLPDGTSLYDLLGPGFTLICTEAADAAPFGAAAHELKIPLKVVEVPVQNAGATLLLIRPDQHVAWHGPVQPNATARQILRQVTGQ